MPSFTPGGGVIVFLFFMIITSVGAPLMDFLRLRSSESAETKARAIETAEQTQLMAGLLMGIFSVMSYVQDDMSLFGVAAGFFALRTWLRRERDRLRGSVN